MRIAGAVLVTLVSGFCIWALLQGQISGPIASALLITAVGWALSSRVRDGQCILHITALVCISLTLACTGLAFYWSNLPPLILGWLSQPLDGAAAAGLILANAALYAHVITAEGSSRYFSARPEQWVMVNTIMALLAVLLAMWTITVLIRSNRDLDSFSQAINVRHANHALWFEHELNRAHRQAKFAIYVAEQLKPGQDLVAHLKAAGISQQTSVWRKTSEQPTPAKLHVVLSGGTSHAIWANGWQVEHHHGDWMARTKIGEVNGAHLAQRALVCVPTAGPVNCAPSTPGETWSSDTPSHENLRERRPTDPSRLSFMAESPDKRAFVADSAIAGGSLVLITQTSPQELLDWLLTSWALIAKILGALLVTGIALARLLVYPIAQKMTQAKDELSRSATRWSLVINYAGEGICALDANGRVTLWNPTAERLLGHTSTQALGQVMHELVHSRHPDGTPFPCEDCPSFTVLRDGITRHSINTVFWHRDGHAVHVDLVTAAIREGGKITGSVVVFTDTTERHQLLAKLQRWEDVFTHAKWGVVVGSADGQTLELMNPAFAQMHGYTVKELTGRPIADVFAPGERPHLRANLQRAHDQGHLLWESWHLHKNGTEFPVLIDLTPVKNALGQVQYRVVNVQDISERHAAEKVLRESEANLARAQAVARVGSWRYDMSTHQIGWSAETYRIFGIEIGTPIDYPMFLECIHPDDRHAIDQAWQQAMKGARYDIRHRITSTGSTRWVHEQAEFTLDANGCAIAAMGTIQDISDWHASQQELLASRQAVRELAAHNNQRREEERTRIAREIHDHLGQNLTALRMDTARLSAHCATAHPVLLERVQQMTATIDETIDVVRDVSTALRPACLDLGLLAATEWLLAGFEKRTGIRCTLVCAEDPIDLDNQQATATFRILQEALNNVARHAQASTVRVQLTLNGTDLRLEVVDDGVGFDPATAPSKKSFGIIGMRERALEAGGSLSITRGAACGTHLEVWVPVAKEISA